MTEEALQYSASSVIVCQSGREGSCGTAFEVIVVKMQTNKIIEYSGVPIAAPSANITGQPSGTNLEEIKKHFEGKADYFIDDGDIELGVSSTIVQVVDGKPQILRQGNITLEQMAKL